MGLLKKEDKMKLLNKANLGQPIRAIAKQTSLPKTTVSRLLSQSKELQKLRDEQRTKTIQRLQGLIEKGMEQVDTMEARSLMEASTSLAILIDKQALLEGRTQGGNVNIDQRQITFKVSPDSKDVIQAEGQRNK